MSRLPNKKDENISSTTSRRVDRAVSNMDNIINDINNSLFGTDTTDEVSELQSEFNRIIKSEVKDLTNGDTSDITSFINKLYSKDKRSDSFRRSIDQDFLSLNMDGMDSTLAAFINERYRNRIAKQADIEEISSQLIELKEAISVTRDAITSPDINTGRINREISFGDYENDQKENYTATIEAMEKKFDLSKVIKDFVVNNTLKQGEYAAYCIPYSILFNDFMKKKDKFLSTGMYSYNESAEDEAGKIRKIYSLESEEDLEVFAESCYDKYQAPIDKSMTETLGSKTEHKKQYVSELKEVMGRVSVNMEEIPLPVLEEGLDSIVQFREEFVSESGDMFVEHKNGTVLNSTNNSFKNYMNNSASEGIYSSSEKKSSKNDFKDIKDCYLKMISPMQLIPIQMMSEEIGYLYLSVEDATPVGGLVSTGMYNKKYAENNKERDIVDDIAARIVKRFDKKFLKENSKFKKTIVEAINYYDLNENRVCFQFVPKEYIFNFKIDTDENNHGRSMLEDSLFYAKLYLMLLLFKMMSIIMYSNDQKVNYVRQSGINKDLTNKVQSLIRQKQARTINMMDLFSYTTLINKVGSGMEMYIPVGRNGERPVETEILSGQEVQLNTELMELLRNSYILGTGVPSAIMNYLNEADFAKSIETANTKFNGRVINYQLDLNPQITELYRALARWSTNIPEEAINELTVILPAPKNASNNITQEMINNFTSTADFLVQLYYGDGDPNTEIASKMFRKDLAKRKLTIINWDEVEEIFNETQKKANSETLLPQQEDDLDNQLDI